MHFFLCQIVVHGYSVTDGGGQDQKHGENACTNDKSPTAKYKGQRLFQNKKVVAYERVFTFKYNILTSWPHLKKGEIIMNNIRKPIAQQIRLYRTTLCIWRNPTRSWSRESLEVVPLFFYQCILEQSCWFSCCSLWRSCSSPRGLVWKLWSHRWKFWTLSAVSCYWWWDCGWWHDK